MGLFTKALFVLIIALSTPVVYRQFASDKTVKFISSYYSNFKVVDTFLKQSAGRFDSAQEYLPKREQLEKTFNSLHSHIHYVVDSVFDKLDETRKVLAKPSIPTPDAKYVQCPDENEKVRLWTKEELSLYDGISNEHEILLAFLGLVYNVTANKHHYSVGSDYNSFAGRDATRAFVTGNFTHDLTDDVSGLEDSSLAHLDSWASFYTSSYPKVGRLVGYFYDSIGCQTKQLKSLLNIMKNLSKAKEHDNNSERDYPGCNSEWNSETKKGRVWCTNKSGGVERHWTGVPRIFNEGDSPRCGCFNDDALANERVKGAITLYPGCQPEASECVVTQ